MIYIVDYINEQRYDIPDSTEVVLHPEGYPYILAEKQIEGKHITMIRFKPDGDTEIFYEKDE